MWKILIEDTLYYICLRLFLLKFMDMNIKIKLFLAWLIYFIVLSLMFYASQPLFKIALIKGVIASIVCVIVTYLLFIKTDK
jgi:hypothetical protein